VCSNIEMNILKEQFGEYYIKQYYGYSFEDRTVSWAYSTHGGYKMQIEKSSWNPKEKRRYHLEEKNVK